MKPNRFERDYKDTPAPASGVECELSNKTKISRTQGKIGLNCDLCGMPFETYACWAKRVNRHYCSKGCASAGKVTQVENTCVICGDTFLTQKNYKEGSRNKKTTCSMECRKEKRRRFLIKEAKNMSESPIFNYGNHEKGEQISPNLSDDDVRAIRADQRPQTKIAAQYGISQSNVSQIKARKTWVHVDDYRSSKDEA